MRNNLLALVIVFSVIALVVSLPHNARLPQPRTLSSWPAASQEVSILGVHLGMTESEVQAVLNRKSNHRMDVPKFASYQLTWQYPDWMVSGMFQNGRLAKFDAYNTDLKVGARVYTDKSSFDALDRDLGPAAAVDPNGPGGGWAHYPRLHLKVAFHGQDRHIGAFTLGEWGREASQGNRTVGQATNATVGNRAVGNQTPSHDLDP